MLVAECTIRSLFDVNLVREENGLLRGSAHRVDAALSPSKKQQARYEEKTLSSHCPAPFRELRKWARVSATFCSCWHTSTPFQLVKSSCRIVNLQALCQGIKEGRQKLRSSQSLRPVKLAMGYVIAELV